jgi:hypothetical protein
MNETPPKGNIDAILLDRICSLEESIIREKINHNKKTPANPAKKALNGLCRIKMETIKAHTAMLHQGRYRPAVKLNNAVSKIETMNFIG